MNKMNFAEKVIEVNNSYNDLYSLALADVLNAFVEEGGISSKLAAHIHATAVWHLSKYIAHINGELQSQLELPLEG